MSRFVVKDTFFKKAKQEGFRARSAYKLKEIQDRFRFIRKGDKVLDLGCAPGSFLQVISTIVGPEGRVAGIDILPVTPMSNANVLVLIADIRDLDVSQLLDKVETTGFQVVTCDIAPNLSGIRDVDEANIGELFEAVSRIVGEALKPEGTLLLKSFFSSTLEKITAHLKRTFKKVTVFKPVASRTNSSEIYLLCTGKK
jgi:23S rRNA (uridine2552-2'-O)-methyltransferase